MNKFLFYIENYVFVDSTSDEFILYNTLDGEYIIGKIEENYFIKKIILNDIRTQFITEDECIKHKKFINEMKDKFIGDVFSVDISCKNLPFNFPMSLKIKKQINDINKQDITLIKNIKIVIGKYPTYFKSKNNDNVLPPDYSLIFNTIDSIIKTHRIELSIILPDIISNEIIEALFIFVDKYKTVNIEILHSNYEKLSHIFNKDIFKQCFFSFYFKDDENMNISYPKNVINSNYIIKNEKDFHTYLADNRDYDFTVVSSDIKFIYDLYKYEIDELKALNQDIKTFYLRKFVNKNTLGQVYIYNNKFYSSELLDKYLPIKHQNIEVVNFLLENEWFIVRETTKKCSGCIFKNICPDISLDEILLNTYCFCYEK